MKSLSCLLKGLKVLQRTSGEDVNVHRIQFDSRKVEAGDLFVAERGEVSEVQSKAVVFVSRFG